MSRREFLGLALVSQLQVCVAIYHLVETQLEVDVELLGALVGPAICTSLFRRWWRFVHAPTQLSKISSTNRPARRRQISMPSTPARTRNAFSFGSCRPGPFPGALFAFGNKSLQSCAAASLDPAAKLATRNLSSALKRLLAWGVFLNQRTCVTVYPKSMNS